MESQLTSQTDLPCWTFQVASVVGLQFRIPPLFSPQFSLFEGLESLLLRHFSRSSPRLPSKSSLYSRICEGNYSSSRGAAI
mmetsp:Transcript_631/g.878  ORF Transcript_631/g.878 Transcript_631/m.878 type:complete len:81 (-) Transcript_631:95-337(-)